MTRSRVRNGDVRGISSALSEASNSQRTTSGETAERGFNALGKIRFLRRLRLNEAIWRVR